MDGLSVSGLADLAGTTAAEVERLVQLGVLTAQDGAGPFLESDVPKVRLATACQRAGLPMEGIVSAIQAGRLSFSFLEGTPFRRWAVRSGRTYRQVSQDTGIPLETLGAVLEQMGFARVGPEELMWTEGLVERIEHELEQAGILGRPGRVPAMLFLDLVGYTHLTEERGDVAAAALAETLGVLVDRSAREHGGVPVKWLG